MPLRIAFSCDLDRRNAPLSDYKFSESEKIAIWTADGKKCFYEGDLITILRTKPLDKTKANKAVQSTRTAVVELQKQLRAAGLSLRNQYRAGGADAEQMISDAIGQRSVWLSDLQAEIDKQQVSEKTIAEGSEILNHQRTAGMALGEVIDKLPK